MSAWSGGAIAAGFCGAVGLFFALFPSLWMRVFTIDEQIIRIGVSYLQIVGPAYALYGLGIGLYFACQGYGKLTLAVIANGVRLLVAAGGGFIALFWIEVGTVAIFTAIALGFAAYAGLTSLAVSRIKVPR